MKFIGNLTKPAVKSMKCLTGLNENEENQHSQLYKIQLRASIYSSLFQRVNLSCFQNK